MISSFPGGLPPQGYDDDIVDNLDTLIRYSNPEDREFRIDSPEGLAVLLFKYCALPDQSNPKQGLIFQRFGNEINILVSARLSRFMAERSFKALYYMLIPS